MFDFFFGSDFFFLKVCNKKMLFCRSCWEAEALSEEEVEEMDEMLRWSKTLDATSPSKMICNAPVYSFLDIFLLLATLARWHLRNKSNSKKVTREELFMIIVALYFPKYIFWPKPIYIYSWNTLYMLRYLRREQKWFLPQKTKRRWLLW